MTERENSKRYDLEERTYDFARKVRAFIKLLNKTLANIEDAKQVIRSSGSVAANYIEANEALSKKTSPDADQNLPQRAKESRLFLRLIDTIGNHQADIEQQALIQEAQELTNIFGAIVRKSE